MCEREKLSRLLKELSQFCAELFGERLKTVILFGSYARGDYDEESDIDVMVVVDMPPEELRGYRRSLADFCADLNVDNAVFVSPSLQSMELFERWKEVVPFYRNVAKEGVEVYG